MTTESLLCYSRGPGKGAGGARVRDSLHREGEEVAEREKQWAVLGLVPEDNVGSRGARRDSARGLDGRGWGDSSGRLDLVEKRGQGRMGQRARGGP